MIDHDRKLLFIHITRTGGTSVETALLGKDWWHIDDLTKHISASQAREIYGEEVWNSYYRFSIVRNPWDRLVSMWATGWWYGKLTVFGGVKPASFADFIRRVQPHPHEGYTSLRYVDIIDLPIDRVLRFESLQADMDALCRDRGIAEVELPHIERRDRLPYQAFYDREAEQAVRERFAADIATYGYQF
jgi:hypothetical protein